MSVLLSRTTSAFPVAIGTSLALESAFTSGGDPYDKDRIKPAPVNLNKYQEIWINVSTLFRNIYSSVPADEAEKASYEDYAQVLWSEIEFIKDLVARDTQGRVKVMFYVANYSHLAKIKDGTVLREQNTPKQVYYKFLHDHAIKALLQYNQKNFGHLGWTIHVFDKYVMPSGHPNVLIMTHIPYDLVKFAKFAKLDLLESHTGITKSRPGWHTKLHGCATNPGIPFSERMLKFYGDSHMFKPASVKARFAVTELAKAKRWTWMTTDDKVKNDVKSLQDPSITALVLGYET